MTFAPCRPADRQYLAELMESVEDIPADSILEGLPWDWETYGEYLDTLDRIPTRHQRRRDGRSLRGAAVGDG